MLLKSLKLTNIRSYTDQEISFPEGSLLLAGDIGSGKSTILLAIEFALFGAKKTELPAGALLRHGKREGNVELRLDIEGKEIIISRNLKRGKNGISQEAGYIIKNGIKTPGTHIELKAMMLELLGYPKELVSKSKDLIYRYTVYTPQEQMKMILLEKTEDRLDTLRKVFNIDKYKRIRENAAVFIRSLKEKVKELEGFTSDLSDKKKKRLLMEKELNEINLRLKELIPSLEKKRISLKRRKESISAIEEKIKELNNLNKELEISEINLKNKLEQRAENKKEIENLKRDVKSLTKELEDTKPFNPEEIKEQIKANEQEIEFIEKNSIISSNKISELNLEIKKSKQLIDKIQNLSTCPTCKQDVDIKHKESISTTEKDKISRFETEMARFQAEEKQAYEKLKKIKDLNETLKKQLNSLELIKLKQNNIDDKKNLIRSLHNSQEKIKEDIGQINIKKKQLFAAIEQYKDIEERYRKEKEELENCRNKERELEIKKAAFEKEKEGIEKLICSLDEEIKIKEERKKKSNYISQLQNWLDNYFINLMANIEKHVMLKVHNEFNSLFKEWFDILIDDEGLNVRLDEEFTPLIEQDGYETNFENLSGGEKTAISLAYRLSLNKVINDVAGNIKTKDIIMLDEPTDGFSAEQLDKMRDVLEQLNMQQVIIVSHEQKMESFVDNVIRVNKTGHISSLN